jgi:hypothetical protein
MGERRNNCKYSETLGVRPKGRDTPVKSHYSLVKYFLPDAINPKADSHGMRMAKLKSQGSGLLQTNPS